MTNGLHATRADRLDTGTWVRFSIQIRQQSLLQCPNVLNRRLRLSGDKLFIIFRAVKFLFQKRIVNLEIMVYSGVGTNGVTLHRCLITLFR